MLEIRVVERPSRPQKFVNCVKVKNLEFFSKKIEELKWL